MKKPKLKKYTYSNGELRDPIVYIEALELYINHLEAENKQLSIPLVVDSSKRCPKCDSKKTQMFTADMDMCKKCKHQWYV